MAGSASFFQTWPREGRRLRHLRRQARPSPVPRQAAPEGLRPRPSGTRTPLLGAARDASRAASPPAAGSMEAGPAPRRAWRRGSSAGPASARPRIPGGCKHGSQRYTTPAPALAAGHTHTRSLRERTERASGSKFAFPPAVLPVATGARGRQRVNARALAPPSAPSARLPLSPSELRAAPSPRRGRSPVARRWPPLLASHRGRGRPRGFCLLLPGSGSSAPGGSSSSCPCFPRPPSSNLTFRGGGGGGRGDPACAARAVGRRRLAEAAWSRAACGVRACGRAEPPEPSYSRERRETMEGKGGWSAALASLPPPPAKAPHCA